MKRISIGVGILLLLATAHCGPFGQFNKGLDILKSLPRISVEITKKAADEITKQAEKTFNEAKSIIEKTKSKSKEMGTNLADNIAKSSNKIKDIITQLFKIGLEESNDVGQKIHDLLKLFSEVVKRQDEMESLPNSSEKNIPTPPKSPEDEKPSKGLEQPIDKKPEESGEQGQELKTPIITTEIVEEVNKQKGVGVVNQDYHMMISKLAHPEIRHQLIRGFFKKPTSEMSICEPAYDEISALAPIAIQLMTSSSNQESIMLAITSKIRMDSVMEKLNDKSPYLECFNVEDTNLKVFLLKLALDGNTFLENCKENEDLWNNLENAMSSFNLGAFEATGESLAQAVKAGSKVKVNFDDDKLSKVNFWTCFNTILKTKRSQPVTNNAINDWRRSAADSTTVCLNSVN